MDARKNQGIFEAYRTVRRRGEHLQNGNRGHGFAGDDFSRRGHERPGQKRIEGRPDFEFPRRSAHWRHAHA